MSSPEVYAPYAIEKVADVFDDSVIAHFTKFNKIRKIFRHGLLSQEFASRARVPIEKHRTKWDRWVYFTNSYRDHGNESDVVFLMRKPDDSIHLGGTQVIVMNRVAPRDLIGVAVSPDKIQDVLRFANLWGSEKGNALPIYDLGTGGLLWPRMMSHEEIVEELRGKGGVQNEQR